MMKQSTLNVKKRVSTIQTSSVVVKKRKIESTTAGSLDEPIDLDDSDGDAAAPITILEELEETLVVKKAIEAAPEVQVPSPAASSPPPKDRHGGPSTTNPLKINDPTFELESSLTHVKPKVILKDPELDLLYFKTMIKGRQLYNYLLDELPWYRVTYPTRGITIRTPRWTCVWGCDETGAPPSAYKIKPRPIPKMLKALKEFVEKETEKKYNFVLVNFYENGQDSISWHSDDESFLGPLPCIASLSLGSPRDFQMKHKTDKSARVEKWSLESGDMVVMRGTTQSKWLHAVPKRAKAGGRINITFRRAMNVAGTNNYYRYNVYTGPAHRWKDGRMEATS